MTLLNLRKSLAQYESIQIEPSKDAILVSVPETEFDIHALRNRIKQGESIADLCKGDLVGKFPSISAEYDEYLRQQREEFRKSCMDALVEEMRQATRAGDKATFAATFGAANGMDPTHESMLETAMTYYATKGSPDQVDKVFEDYKECLQQQVDVDPSAALLGSHEKLRAVARGRGEYEVRTFHSRGDYPRPRRSRRGRFRGG